MKERPFQDFASRRMMFEAADEEEAEIINRHLGKWGDRNVRPARERNNFRDREYKKNDERRERRRDDERGREWNRERSGDRERFTSREARQDARREFFAGQGKGTKPFSGKSFGEGRRGAQDERRPRRDGERPDRKFDRPKNGNRPFRGKRD